jgi:hypothetical protein
MRWREIIAEKYAFVCFLTGKVKEVALASQSANAAAHGL